MWRSPLGMLESTPKREADMHVARALPGPTYLGSSLSSSCWEGAEELPLAK